MSMPFIRREVAFMRDEAKVRIAEAEAKLAMGRGPDQVVAAGQLAMLKRQASEIEERLREIDAHPDASETAFQWFKEEWFNVRLRLETLMAGGA